MQRTHAILGSALFLVAAPGVAAGLIPWWLTRWALRPPLLGFELTRSFGAMLILAGVLALVGSFVRFALQGLGTPAPVAPTQHLVSRGSTVSCAIRCTSPSSPSSSARRSRWAIGASSSTEGCSGSCATFSWWRMKSGRCDERSARNKRLSDPTCRAGFARDAVARGMKIVLSRGHLGAAATSPHALYLPTFHMVTALAQCLPDPQHDSWRCPQAGCDSARSCDPRSPTTRARLSTWPAPRCRPPGSR